MTNCWKNSQVENETDRFKVLLKNTEKKNYVVFNPSVSITTFIFIRGKSLDVFSLRQYDAWPKFDIYSRLILMVTPSIWSQIDASTIKSVADIFQDDWYEGDQHRKSRLSGLAMNKIGSGTW